VPFNASTHALRSSSTQTYQVDIAAGNFFSVNGTYSARTLLFGNFLVTNGILYNIDFFIFNSTNFQRWTNGQSADASLAEWAVASYNWTFWVPYADKWYFVFSNTFSITHDKKVSILFGSGTGPIVTILSPQGYSETGQVLNGTVLISANAITDQPSISSISISIDGNPMTTAHNSSVKYSWDTTSSSDDFHTITVTATDSVGNSNSATVVVRVQNHTSGGAGALSSDLLMPVTIFVIVIIIFAFAVMRGRKRSREPPDLVLTPNRMTARPAGKGVAEAEPILCPYCGAKNVSDARFCRNCGANMKR
jgi:hypothetical protein